MRRCRQLPRARFRRNAWIWSCDDQLRIAWCRDTRSTMRLAGDANPAALQARARHVRTAARNDAPPPSSTARTTRPSASGPGWDALRRKQYSATGTRTRVARVRAEHPNQLDYSGVVSCCASMLSARILFFGVCVSCLGGFRVSVVACVRVRCQVSVVCVCVYACVCVCV